MLNSQLTFIALRSNALFYYWYNYTNYIHFVRSACADDKKKERPNRFAVVVFDEEDGVEVVPTEWLNDDEAMCRWPNDNVRGLYNLVRKSVPIDDSNSTWYSCRILYKSGESSCIQVASHASTCPMYTLAVTSFHVYTCMSIVATYQDADEKAERGMETSQVIDSDAARDADAEGGRGKRNKT